MIKQAIDLNEKLSGVLIPVFALRHDNDLGIGDTQAVMDAIDFCARNKLTVLQVLPINETGGDNSPYNAISSIALEPVLLSMTPDVVPGLTAQAMAQILEPGLVQSLRQGAVNYPGVKQLKHELLKAAFKEFRLSGQDHLEGLSFEQFKKDQSMWLPDYTLFRTLVWLHNGAACWPLWDNNQRNAQLAKQWLSSKQRSAELELQQEYFAFVQWVAFRQWSQVRLHADKHRVRLMGDIPFGVSRYSADVWANQDLFDLEWSGGAPPEKCFKGDPFTAKWGQNWGLPLYRWDRHRKQGFTWWRQRVQHVTRTFHYFRIDHVLGFFRMYAFPWLPEHNDDFVELTMEQAKKRAEGRIPHFVPRSDEKEQNARKNAAEGRILLEMILESAEGAFVVAEDLGSMVPDYVRPLLKELCIPGFTIPYWEHTADFELKPIETLPQCSLATYATHDHSPLKLYYEDLVKLWHGENGNTFWLEIQRLMRFLGLNPDDPPTTFTPELHHALMSALLRTPCWLTVVMISDLLATTERFNEPGTLGESNWSRRLDQRLSWYEKTQPYSDRIADFSKLVETTNRLPSTIKAGTIK